MSDKPKRFPLWLKLLAVALVLALVGLGVQRYLRPVAKVEPVISGDAVDAEPGSVVVKEHYSMQMKSAVPGRVLSKDYKLDTGLRVKEGDILAHLDTADTEIAIEQVQSLNGRLFVDAEDSGVVGRVQVKADDVGRLGFKVGIV